MRGSKGRQWLDTPPPLPSTMGAWAVSNQNERANMSREQEDWKESPQFTEGWWWFYGDEAFGSMGGHFNGSIPPRMEMSLVRIRCIANGLVAVSNGRFTSLTKFDPQTRREGYVGVWKPAQLPEAPTVLIKTITIQ